VFIDPPYEIIPARQSGFRGSPELLAAKPEALVMFGEALVNSAGAGGLGAAQAAGQRQGAADGDVFRRGA